MICSVSVPPETGDRLTDADLRKSEVKLTSIMKPAAFVPAVPVTVLQAVVQARAEKALPLILAIHRQLQMSGREWTPLNAAVWKAAGTANSKQRSAILKKLEVLTEVVRIERHRTPTSYYRAARGALFGNRRWP
jgi:hypothetical protein